jgi:hypothetical protein
MRQKFYLNSIVIYLSLGDFFIIKIEFLTQKDPPYGVILESSFLNMTFASTEYTVLANLFYNNPWIIDMGSKALKEYELQFNTDEQ